MDNLIMDSNYLEPYVDDHRDTFYFESASRLSAIMEAHYQGRIYLNKKRIEARGEVTSILGAITVGYIKFLFNMIKNFILYILQAIKFFVVDSGVLQGMVKGLMSLFGESSSFDPDMNQVKLVDPDILYNEFKRITDIATENNKHMRDYFYNLEDIIKSNKSAIGRLLRRKGRTNVNDLDLLYGLIPPKISNSEEAKFTEDFANQFAINQNNAKKYLGDCQYRFKKYLDSINPDKLNLKPTITIAHKVDASDILRAYKDVMAKIVQEFYNPLTNYLKNINGISDIIQFKLSERMSQEKLNGDVLTATFKDITSLFYFYCDGLFSKVVLGTDYMVKDMQTIRDTIIEQVANLSKAL